MWRYDLCLECLVFINNAYLLIFPLISTGKEIESEHETEETTGKSKGTTRKSGRKGMSSCPLSCHDYLV